MICYSIISQSVCSGYDNGRTNMMEFRPEITLPFCTAIIMAGLAVLKYMRYKNGAGSILMGQINGNLKNMFISKKDCIKNQVEKDLQEGRDNFEKIHEQLKVQGEMLARIDERSKLWVEIKKQNKGG